MKKNARDLIYLDTQRYLSLDRLRVFYWGILLIPIVMVVFGIAGIRTVGIQFKSLFPLVSVAIWSLLYWIFVSCIQYRRTKTTFEMRFLVNGVSGLLMSSLFWILFTSFHMLRDRPILHPAFPLWMLLSYVIFSVIYIALIVLGVHKGVYKKIREKTHTAGALALDALFASMIPVAGTLGMVVSRSLRAHASVRVQEIVGTISIVLLILLPAMAHINFVQYYYCKKYNITCDEYGNRTSPALERRDKSKKIRKSKNSKGLPLAVKILIGVIAVPVILFLVVFLVFFIKGFIKGIG